MKKLSFITIMFLVLLISACDFATTEINRDSVLESITVDVSEAEKLEYFIGDNFDSKGIKVFGHYSDKTIREEDMRLVSFSEIDTSKACENATIKVFYEDKETHFDVKVYEARIEKIQIAQTPKKLFYGRTEVNDTTGLIVKAIYTNGMEKQLLENEYTISGFNPECGDDKCPIYVKLVSDTSIFDTYYIWFEDYTIKQLRIEQEPNRSVYMEGEELDLTGIKVIAIPNDDSGVPPFEIKQYNWSPDSIKEYSATEKLPITITVNEASASFDIRIVKSYVTGFVIKDKDNNNASDINDKTGIGDSKYLYCVGEEFSLEHYKFYELFSNGELGDEITEKNGKTEKLTCNYTSQTFIKSGIHTIPITYEYYDERIKNQNTDTKEIKVCVVDSVLDHIEAYWEDKGGYPLGITPDNSEPEKYGSWTIEGILKDGTSIYIEPKYCTFEYKEIIYSLGGEDFVYYDVVVKYFDIRSAKEFVSENKESKVKVIPPVIKTIKLIRYPSKLEYIQGEPIELAGMRAEATFTDPNHKVVYEDNFADRGISVKPEVAEGDSVIITFPTGFSYTLPITIIGESFLGIDIVRKINSYEFLFRAGENCDSNFFMNKFFDVYEKTNRGNNAFEELDSADISFSIIPGELDRIIAVYQPKHNPTISYSAKYQEETPDEIQIFHALPRSVEITIPEDEPYTGLNGIVNSNKVKLYVTYEDNSEAYLEKKDGKFSDAAGEYTLSKCEDDNKSVQVTFKRSKASILEQLNGDPEKRIFINKIKNRIIVEKTGNNIFRYSHQYDWGTYFNVYMEYKDGSRQKIASEDINFTPLWNQQQSYKGVVSGELLVGYQDKDGSELFYDVYNNFKYCPPSPSKITVTKDNSKSTYNNNLSQAQNNYIWTITYDDNSTVTSSTISSTLSGREGIEIHKDFDDYGNYIITYSIKENNEYSNYTGYNYPTNQITIPLNKVEIKNNKNNQELLFIDTVEETELKKIFNPSLKYSKDQIEYENDINVSNYKLSISRINSDNSSLFKKTEGKIDLLIFDKNSSYKDGIYVVPDFSDIKMEIIPAGLSTDSNNPTIRTYKEDDTSDITNKLTIKLSLSSNPFVSTSIKYDNNSLSNYNITLINPSKDVEKETYNFNGVTYRYTYKYEYTFRCNIQDFRNQNQNKEASVTVYFRDNNIYTGGSD